VVEKFLRLLVVIGGLAVVAAIGARLYIFHPYRIPSGGMIPTYRVGAHIIGNHLQNDPVRGKAIVFPNPENPRQDFVQRIIGVGGDRIRVIGGHPWVNEWEVPHCDVGKYDTIEDGAPHHFEIFVEFLGPSTYLVAIEPALAAPSEDKTWTVKPGYVFTMGDNRMNSYDSRSWPSQSGVATSSIEDGLEMTTTPEVPSDATALQSALDACLAKRPAKTSP
jgi:signal peptidase I